MIKNKANGLLSSKLKDTSGAILFTSVLSITTILLVFSTLLYFRSIAENSSVRHELASAQAQYAAEGGVEYVYYEFANSAPSTTQWYTHTVGGNNSLDYNLGSAFTILLSSNNELSSNGYSSKAGSAFQFSCKVYNDPSETVISGKIVLCRGNSGNERKLIAQKVGLSSLYEYFMFFPESDWRMSGYKTYDANGGKIHTNKNIHFGSPQGKLINVSSLSAAGHIFYMNGGNLPPFVDTNGTSGFPRDAQNYTQLYNCDDPNNDKARWVDIYNANGWSEKLPDQWKFGWCSNKSDRADCWFDQKIGAADPAYNYNYLKWWWHNTWAGGDNYRLICRNSTTGVKKYCDELDHNYVASDWDLLDPANKDNNQSYMYANMGGSTDYADPYVIQPVDGPEVKVPSHLSSEYNWMPYRMPCEREEEKWFSGPLDYNGKKYGIPQSMFDPNNREDCVSPFCVKQTFTHTGFQAGDWINFLDSSEGQALKGVVKEASTGGTVITNPTVNAANYRTTAENMGIHIVNTIDPNDFNNPANFINFKNHNINTLYSSPERTLENNGNYKVLIGGTEYLPDENGVVIVEGFEVFRKKGFYNYYSTLWEQMVSIDVANLKELINNEKLPNVTMNMIYSDWGVGLERAATLPNNGLTVITEGDVFAVGDINTVDYQPASVITKRLFYGLSDNFNFPQQLPELINHPAAGDGYPNITNQNYVTDEENRQFQQQTFDNGQAPNKVLKDQTYNISIIGEYAPMESFLSYGFTYLELWSYPSDDKWNDPNFTTTAYNRTFNGTFLLLPQDSFVSRYNYGPTWTYISRRCDGEPRPEWWPSCREEYPQCHDGNGWCAGYPQTVPNTTWPKGMGLTMSWESQYATGSKPPGDLGGVSIGGWLALPYSDANFSKHCQALQSNP